MKRKIKQKNKWYSKYSYNKKTMIPFDFESYMKDNKLSLKDMESLCRYSRFGIIRMFDRGTIKQTLLSALGTEVSLKKYMRDI